LESALLAQKLAKMTQHLKNQTGNQKRKSMKIVSKNSGRCSMYVNQNKGQEKETINLADNKKRKTLSNRMSFDVI